MTNIADFKSLSTQKANLFQNARVIRCEKSFCKMLINVFKIFHLIDLPQKLSTVPTVHFLHSNEQKT